MRRVFNTVRSLLPKPLEKWASNLYEYLPYPMRYGAVYRDTFEFLQKSQFWSHDQLIEYQVAKLRELIRHAMTNVPFYKRKYGEIGISPEDIQSIDIVHSLPTISKHDLVKYREELKASNFPPSKFQYHTTGGSTGHPVGLYWEADRTVPMEKAFMQRQFSWINHNPEKDRVVTIRGIPPSKGKMYEMIGARQLRLSSYQLTPSIMGEYVRLIKNFRPDVLHVYPSSALLLAQFLLDNRLEPFQSVRAILCGSEQMFDRHRDILAEAFRCRIYSWYGQSEYVSLAGECEYSTEYHFYSEYGITEIIGENGRPALPGETGEIVATGFLNFAFPLIRYKMGDLATLSTLASCECGRPYIRASRIEGRIQEMIVSKNSNLISMTAINMHTNVFDSLYQFQFYQDTPGKIIMNIIPKPSHSLADEDRILKALQDKVGDQFDIQIRHVSSTTQTLRGKTGFLIQKLPVERFNRD